MTGPVTDRAALVADRTRRGTDFCRAATAWADAWLSELFEAAVAAAGAPAGSYALVAVGGYGRRELCPGSDLDVALVGGGRRRRDDVAEVAAAIWRPLWDAGLKLGNSVWTVKEALSLAAGDLDTATTLLSVRPVAGDRALAADLAERARAQWQAKSATWLARLADAVDERHHKAGEVAFMLEPDLKEGRGGLRDVHALRWADDARRVVLDADDARLGAAYEALLEARVELHRTTGRSTDRLLLQDQDAVAEALGDDGADALMARVAAAARTIAWTSDDTWRRIRSSLAGPRGRGAGGDQPVGPGLVLREGVVELGPDADPGADPTLALRAAAAAAVKGVPLGRRTLERLAGAALPGDPWPDAARRALLRLLGAGPPAIASLEALDQAGILSGLVPEWERVRSRPQRNAYHRFTVDRHLCEAAVEAGARAEQVHRPDLLLMGAWLHDIGKGFTDLVPSGDHSEAGVLVIERIASRMGFPPADVAVLADLVRHHLLLPDLATRRDVADPATARAVADAVGSRETLALLHALTEADSIATGSAAWSRWKAELVADLVAAARRVLAGEPPAAGPPELTPAQEELVARVRDGEGLVLRGDGRELTVAAADRPGLFCTVAGTLSLHRLDVLAARGWSADGGVALDEFVVEPAFGGEPDWDRVRVDLERALAGRLPLEARMAGRSREYATWTRLPAAGTPRARVVIDNESSPAATVVEVWAPDRVGTLYRITRALADLRLDIRHAKIATLGPEVVDSFYVVDPEGGKVVDAEHVRAVEDAILLELSRL